ncbi:MAG: hypothetical protein KDH15_10120 [Rhodocyclaceae bacterium]|nr:hypothetical protein [Rhodocyclaceae bacterium]
MKKNLIALSVAAMVGGLAVSTGARADVVTNGTDADFLQFTQDGIGHALIVPYFNVQNGNMSVFHVVNTDTINGKAVKVRFRGASNSDDVFDFQVYLSPGDVFTGAVTQAASGAAQFVTADTTCTIPGNVNQEFVLSRLSEDEQVAGVGSREGYIEIFNMGDIPEDEVDLGDGTTVTAADVDNDGEFDDVNILYTAIKHVDGEPPCGLTTDSRLVALLSTNTDATVSATPGNQDGDLTSSLYVKGMNNPTGTLMGGWYIINVDGALSYSGNDATILAVDSTSPQTVNGNFQMAVANGVFWPQRDFTIGGDINFFSADPLLKLGGTAAGIALGGVEPRAFDLPDMSTPYTSTLPNEPHTQAALLSLALAVTSIVNEFATDAVISAASDWTFTMPSRRYNAAVRYNDGVDGNGAPSPVYTDLNDGEYHDLNGDDADYSEANINDGFYSETWVEGADYNDADNYFTPVVSATQGNTELVGSQLCVSDIGVSYTDREEGEIASPAIEFVISPSTPAATPEVLFCGEASVLKFNVSNTAESVLGAGLATQGIEMVFDEAGSTYSNGWATLTTPGLTGKGLPILGSYFLKAVNPLTAAGVAANYGLIFQHRVTRPTLPL